jgi:hypothetical protein
MMRGLAVTLVLAAGVPHAWAKADEDDSDSESDDEEAESSDDSTDDEEATDDDGLPAKQNLTGHDEQGKKPTEFERNRFFVDKVDSEKTEKGTLVQGSISSSSFFYGEAGGNYPNLVTAGATGENTGPKRLFTELRLQTDFRHIKASRWEARIDVRGRFVNTPPNNVSMAPALATEPNRVQSGLLGTNELDVREMWLIRSGKRSDVFIGRQFLPDLGGLKFDGIRVDYAKSSKLTLIGFGGLFPLRGSRSVTTDYAKLEDSSGNSAGRFVVTGGFGGAYRTPAAYGAVGGVIQYPLQKEQPRVYLTTNGYLRNGAKLDVFHYILVDVLGSAAQESTSRIQLTNLSGGLNFKPNPRLRLTAAFHRVDTETLNVQANAFLNEPDLTGVGGTIIQSDTYLQRIATNTARGGISAGLGKQQRFEISTAISYRFRPAFTLRSPDPNTPTLAELPGASSVEVWGSLVDRRSIKNERIGIEASQSFAVGQLAYNRSLLFTGRLFVLREIANGKGEWEAEASYSQVRDTVIGTMLGCVPMNIADCYGSSNNTLFQIGGQVFYRLKPDWFGIATLHVLRMTNLRSDKVEDPAVLGLTGFVRIAKRF